MEGHNLTVVVATKNRPQALAGLLASLLCQTLSQFKLLIALNGERSWHPYLTKMLNALRARGVNTEVHECFQSAFVDVHEFLLKKVRTEYVCRVDDDHILDSHYLAELMDVITKGKTIGAVGGIVLHPGVPGHSFSTTAFIKALHCGRRNGILNTVLQLKRHPTSRPIRVPDLYSSFMARVLAVKRVGEIATCYRSYSYREETDLTLNGVSWLQVVHCPTSHSLAH